MAKREGHYVKLGPALDAEVAAVAAAVNAEPGQILAAVLRRYLAPGTVGDAYAETVNRQLALLGPRPSETPRVEIAISTAPATAAPRETERTTATWEDPS